MTKGERWEFRVRGEREGESEPERDIQRKKNCLRDPENEVQKDEYLREKLRRNRVSH